MDCSLSHYFQSPYSFHFILQPVLQHKKQNNCAHFPDCPHSCGKIPLNISKSIICLLHYIWIMHAKLFEYCAIFKIERHMSLSTKRLTYEIKLNFLQ